MTAEEAMVKVRDAMECTLDADDYPGIVECAFQMTECLDGWIEKACRLRAKLDAARQALRQCADALPEDDVRCEGSDAQKAYRAAMALLEAPCSTAS